MSSAGYIANRIYSKWYMNIEITVPKKNQPGFITAYKLFNICISIKMNRND